MNQEEHSLKIAELEAALRTYHAFSDALAHGGAAVYRRNFSTGEFDFVSSSIESITGYTVEEFTTELWDGLVEHVDLLGDLADEDPDEAIARFRKGEFTSWHAEARFRHKSGENRWLIDISSSIRDASDGLVGSIGLLQDITELKDANQREEALRQRLERSKRIESIGMLAGAVAHDLNNILVPVLAYPDLILSEVSEDSPIAEYAREISTAAKRASNTIGDLLALAHREIAEANPVNLRHVVDCALESQPVYELRLSHPNVEIQTDLAADVPYALGSEKALVQAVTNLLISAYEFMPDGGDLGIAMWTVEALPFRDGKAPSIKEGRYVVLEISDTGAGLDDEDVDRIFEPFYTKRLLGRSTSGLSLAVAYGLVKDHGGHIEVVSELGKGTHFTVYLPTTESKPVKKDKAAGDMGGSETVLIVDDEDAPRTVASRFLSRLGYRALTAKNGRDAIEQIQPGGAAEKASLLVLDMVMEEDFDGLTTYESLLEIRPGLKCIIVSGYAETDRVREALSIGAGAFIRKPYTIEQLGQAVRKELDRPAASSA